MKRFSFIASFSSLVICSFPAMAASVGTVLEVEGTATVASTPAVVGSEVHIGDMIETGSGARLFVMFNDETELTLGEKAQMRIDSYVYNPGQDGGSARYSALQGAFQYVSGLIGHGAAVETPVGSIGLRGTVFWGGAVEGEYNIAVLDGKVALKNDAGETLVSKGEAAAVRDRRTVARRARFDRQRLARMTDTVRLKNAPVLRSRVNARRQQLRQRQGALQQEQRGKMRGMIQQREEMREKRKRVQRNR